MSDSKKNSSPDSRRLLLKSGLALGGGLALPMAGGLGRAWAAGQAPAIVASDAERPLMEQGIQFGDMTLGSTMLWSRADRPARLHVEYALNQQFTNAVKRVGPHALDNTDFTARLDLTGLPADRTVYVRTWFESLSNSRAKSEPVLGQFRTPALKRDVRFVWGGDTAGQGWGINTSFGGMKIYESMRRVQPDFFIHSGDTIYADGPISETVTAEGGRTWDQYRHARSVQGCRDPGRVPRPLQVQPAGRKRAPLQCRSAANLAVGRPRGGQQLVGLQRPDERRALHRQRRAAADRSRLARLPGIRALPPFTAEESERMYRHLSYGPLLDVFVVDMRSYRGPNTDNLQLTESNVTTFLGSEQVEWLKAALRRSRATWKVIAADMPIGLNIGDGKDAAGKNRWEAIANGDNGPAKGRELEIAGLLRAIKQASIKNVVWLTADVHYCAAHQYEPAKAQFQDFDGFWEFVAGPLNAGSFGPNSLDATFGPRVDFFKAPPPGKVNLSPFAGLQFFGEVNIRRQQPPVPRAFKDIDGNEVYSKTLSPSK